MRDRLISAAAILKKSITSHIVSRLEPVLRLSLLIEASLEEGLCNTSNISRGFCQFFPQRDLQLQSNFILWEVVFSFFGYRI